MTQCEGSPNNFDQINIEHAFSLWRRGESYLHRPLQADWKKDYETAVTIALVYLQDFQSIPELIEEYYSDKRSASDFNDWVSHACQSVVSERKLNQGVVEDAAYFRRAQQLIEN